MIHLLAVGPVLPVAHRIVAFEGIQLFSPDMPCHLASHSTCKHIVALLGVQASITIERLALASMKLPN
jgi:hypothetical protein